MIDVEEIDVKEIDVGKIDIEEYQDYVENDSDFLDYIEDIVDGSEEEETNIRYFSNGEVYYI